MKRIKIQYIVLTVSKKFLSSLAMRSRTKGFSIVHIHVNSYVDITKLFVTREKGILVSGINSIKIIEDSRRHHSLQVYRAHQEREIIGRFY